MAKKYKEKTFFILSPNLKDFLLDFLKENYQGGRLSSLKKKYWLTVLVFFLIVFHNRNNYSFESNHFAVMYNI